MNKQAYIELILEANNIDRLEVILSRVGNDMEIGYHSFCQIYNAYEKEYFKLLLNTTYKEDSF